MVHASLTHGEPAQADRTGAVLLWCAALSVWASPVLWGTVQVGSRSDVAIAWISWTVLVFVFAGFGRLESIQSLGRRWWMGFFLTPVLSAATMLTMLVVWASVRPVNWEATGLSLVALQASLFVPVGILWALRSFLRARGRATTLLALLIPLMLPVGYFLFYATFVAMALSLGATA